MNPPPSQDSRRRNLLAGGLIAALLILGLASATASHSCLNAPRSNPGDQIQIGSRPGAISGDIAFCPGCLSTLQNRLVLVQAIHAASPPAGGAALPGCGPLPEGVPFPHSLGARAPPALS